MKLLLLILNFTFASDPFSTLLDQRTGREIIRNLNNTSEKKDTTSCRREQKGVISANLWDAIIAELKKGKPRKFYQKSIPPVHLQARDKIVEGKKNGTVTLYGQGINFYNQGIKTKIKLRARTYFQINEDSSRNRVKPTKKKVFLELKIKDPSPSKRQSVSKYRIIIKDKDLIKLFNSNPRNSQFSGLIKNIKNSVLENKDNKNPLLVEEMFKTIELLAKRSPEFITPQMAISYERRSYKIIEESKKEPTEYQITVDGNVLGYLVNYRKNNVRDFDEFLNKTLSKPVAKYPNDARVVEFKDPMHRAQLKDSKKTPQHRFLLKTIVETIHSDEAKEYFIPNKGKAGHFRQAFRKILELDSDEEAIGVEILK